MIRTMIFAVALIGGPTIGRAATFNVATTGNDRARGTLDAPLATLQQAARLARAGDTVVVQPGRYTGWISGYDEKLTTLIGTHDAPITFRGGPGVVIVSRNNKTANGIDLIGCRHVVIDSFGIISMPLKGIALSNSAHITIRNCAAVDSARWGIYASKCDDLTIEDCEASRSRIEHGIYVANSCLRPTIRRCRIFDNHDCGLHFNGDAAQGGTGIITGALIEDNLIVGNGVRGGAAINCDGVQGSTIRRNRLVENRAAGITLFRGDASAGAIGNTVEGNVVVMTPGAKYCLGIKGGSTGNAIRGNVLIHPGPKGFAMVMTPDSLPGTTFDDTPAPARYSLDDGATAVDRRGLASVLPGAAR